MSVRRRSLREALTHNFGLKVTSLLVAIALFSMVRGAEDAQRSVFVDVAVALPPNDDGKILVSDVPERVRLTLRGSRSQVNAIRPEELTVTMDLTDTSIQYYYFAEDDFDIPASVQLSQIAPASVPLRWAERLEKFLPIQPDLVGAPPEGLILGEPARVEPGEMTIGGPRSTLQTLRVLQTAPIDLSTLSVGTERIQVPLARLPERCRYGSEAPVTVTLRVVEDVAQRTLVAVPVDVVAGDDAGPRALGIAPEVVSVTLEGPPAIVDVVDPAELRAQVDVSAARAGEEVRVTVPDLPEKLRLVAVEPPAVTAVSP
ncbi:MAG: CdaR family protein [Myxococcota bacterium]